MFYSYFIKLHWKNSVKLKFRIYPLSSCLHPPLFIRSLYSQDFIILSIQQYGLYLLSQQIWWFILRLINRTMSTTCNFSKMSTQFFGKFFIWNFSKEWKGFSFKNVKKYIVLQWVKQEHKITWKAFLRGKC